MLKNFEFYVFLHAVHTLLNLKKHNENLVSSYLFFIFSHFNNIYSEAIP